MVHRLLLIMKMIYRYMYVRYSSSVYVYEKYIIRVYVKGLIQHQAKPSAVLAVRHSLSTVFSYTQARWGFKCYIVFPGSSGPGAICNFIEPASPF